jgi:Dynein attachment factor N-terminus
VKTVDLTKKSHIGLTLNFAYRSKTKATFEQKTIATEKTNFPKFPNPMADQDKITKEEILRLERKCLEKIASEELYQLRNDAKMRACTSSKTYDEFK